MADWYVVCLRGTSSTEILVEVFACSVGSAFWKCERAGFQPLRVFVGPCA